MGSSLNPMKIAQERTAEAAREAKKKMSVAAIAKACGVSRQAVYDWLKGKPIELGPALVELAEISGINARWIVNGKGQKHALSDDEKLIVRAFSLFGPETRAQWLAGARDRIAQDDATRKHA